MQAFQTNIEIKTLELLQNQIGLGRGLLIESYTEFYFRKPVKIRLEFMSGNPLILTLYFLFSEEQ